MRLLASLALPAAAVFFTACMRPDPDAGVDSGSLEDAGEDSSGPLDAGIAPSDTGDSDRDARTVPTDSGDSGTAFNDAGSDADAVAACAVSGAPGRCITVSACAALARHTAYAGYCPGPAGIQCCIVTPSTADNPPIPAGYRLMAQSQVTADMTTWAVAILHDPVTYPMFSTTMRTFGTLMVLARVEWHPPDFQNSVVHRGVTLYVPN